MSFRHLLLPVLSALPAMAGVTPPAAQCPDNGRVLVLKRDKGMQLIRFFGKSSVKAFFPGPGFTWVESDKHNPEPTFWIDDMLVQWMVFARSEFAPSKTTGDQDQLEAYYRYETEYLKMARSNLAAPLNLERFQFETEPGSDGKKHFFLIWSATPNGHTTKQYWIATTHPKGVISMSIIPRAPVDESKIKTLIDSYMASYAILRPDEAVSFMDQLHAFERQGSQSQVPSIRRDGGKSPDESSIPFPPATSSTAR